jgi:5-methylcytosine-specific restriction endonuclease McrA
MIIGRPKSEIIERTKRIRTALLRCEQIRKIKWEQQHGVCLICRNQIESSDGLFCALGHATSVYIWAEQDIPIEEAIARANTEENLVALHVDCNSRQGALELEEFLERVSSVEITSAQERKLLAAEDIERLKHEDFKRRSMAANKAATTLGPERLSAIAKRRQANKSPEQRSAEVRKGRENMGAERRSAASRKRLEKIGPERLSEIATRRQANKSFEERSAAMRKAKERMGPERRSAATTKAAKTIGPQRLSEIATRRQANLGPVRRSAAAKKAIHTRFHVRLNIFKPECEFCHVAEETK